MTKAELIKTHADYSTYVNEWLFFMRSYFGGKRYRDGDYLLQHPFESVANYDRRKKQLFFYNYCQPIVDIFVSLLFKKDPSRDFGYLTGDTLFEAFLADADLEGNSYAQFIREAQRYAAIYGRVSVVVDMPQIQALTKAEAQSKGVRPYLLLVTPENLLDWSYARMDNGQSVLSMAKIRESKNEYRIWTREGWELWFMDDDDNINLRDDSLHSLGVVPIVNIYNRNSGVRMIGISDLEDIAYINRHICYLCSDAQEIVENTAFPMLAQAYDFKGSSDTKEVGPKNILQFDPSEPNSKPFWLEAPHSSLAEIRELILQDITAIYKMANLLGIYSTGQGVQPMAGVAMEIENQQRDAALAEKSDNMEQAEKQIFNLYARWEGKEFDGSINYLNDFSIFDRDKNTVNITNFLTSGVATTPKFWQGLLKKQVENLLPDIPKLTQSEIYSEIENINSVPAANGQNNQAATP